MGKYRKMTGGGGGKDYNENVKGMATTAAGSSNGGMDRDTEETSSPPNGPDNSVSIPRMEAVDEVPIVGEEVDGEMRVYQAENLEIGEGLGNGHVKSVAVVQRTIGLVQSIQQNGNKSCSPFKISINPLEQSVVAQNLLQYIPKDLSSLKSFRFVCRTWRNVSQARWNHFHGTLTIYPPNLSDNPNQNPEGSINEDLHLDRFHQRYSTPKDVLFKYPFQKYDLRFWNLQSDHFTKHPNFSNLYTWFWTTFAPAHIKHLTLHSCNSLGIFTIFSEEFLKALPNLNSLKVFGGTVTPEAFDKVSQQYWSKINYFEHWNLKSVNLEVLIPDDTLRILWCVFQRSLPNLGKLKVRRICEGMEPDEFQLSRFTAKVIGHRSANVALNSLDLIEYTTANLDHRSLQKLPLENPDGISSFPDTYQVFVASLRNGDSVDGGNLDLFLCPLVRPVKGIPSKFRSQNLKELYLWGSISRSLTFLEGLENLRVLIWVTSCWGSMEHRGRVLRFLRGEKGKGEWRNRNPIGGWNEVEVEKKVIKVKNLRRLEVDWRWGKGGWRGFGGLVVMKGLRELKGVVRGDEQLREVGYLWGMQLEGLEFGHGSGGFSREGVMKVVVEGMRNLKEFRWSGCSCLKMEMGEGGMVDWWREVEDGLREKLGEGNFTVPWGRMEGEEEYLEGICLEKEYDKGLETGRIDEGMIDRMMEF